MGEAIDLTNKLYPGLLEKDSNLLFALKCRQFVEMVNGTDSEIFQTNIDNQTSVIQSTKFLNKPNNNEKSNEWSYNHKNGSNTQFYVNGQIEDDVEMEDTTSRNSNNVKSNVSLHKNTSNSNGFKRQNGEETMGKNLKYTRESLWDF